MSGRPSRDDFLSALFEKDDLIEFRLIGNGPVKRIHRQTLPDDETVAKWNEDYDVYFGVNPRTKRTGGDDAVSVCRVVFVDFDGITVDDARARTDALPRPTAIVSSGHGAHVYWRLDRVVGPREFRSIQSRLAEILDSDSSVINPERIMRLPDTHHVVKDDAPCYVDELNPDAVWVQHQLPPLDDPSGVNILSAPTNGTIPVPPWVIAAVNNGAAEGGRDQMAFKIAAAYAGNGHPESAATEAVLEFAARCSPPLPPEEAARKVLSAYSKPRSPASTLLEEPFVATMPEDRTPRVDIGESGGGPFMDGPSSASPDWITIGEPDHPATEPKLVTNYREVEVQTKKGSPVTKRYEVRIPLIAQSISDATGGWPRTAGGMLFAPGDATPDGELPTPWAAQTLPDVDHLFAWLHDRCAVAWTTATILSDQATERKAVGKKEAMVYLRQRVKPRYEGIEFLPHEPEATRTWYAPTRLRPASREVLDNLVDRFNYASSDIDRPLFLAAILSMFWGGPCGARPAIVFASDYGQGSGKTTTAQMIASIAGGSITMGHNEKPEEFTSRLLSDEALSKRVALIDNVKGGLKSSGIESMMTENSISGKRMYYGHMTRPNRLTWLITANSPSLSRDLAERSLVAKIGPQRAGGAWWGETTRFIEEHRADLVAASVGVLRAAPLCEVSEENLGRWGLWNAQVLARATDDADRVLVEVAARRDTVDSDSEQAEDIAEVFHAIIMSAGGLPSDRAFLARRTIREAWRKVDPSMHHNAITSYLRGRMGCPALAPLRETKYDGNRGWVWDERLATKDGRPLDPNFGIKIMECPKNFEPPSGSHESGGNDVPPF